MTTQTQLSKSHLLFIPESLRGAVYICAMVWGQRKSPLDIFTLSEAGSESVLSQVALLASGSVMCPGWCPEDQCPSILLPHTSSQRAPSLTPSLLTPSLDTITSDTITS